MCGITYEEPSPLWWSICPTTFAAFWPWLNVDTYHPNRSDRNRVHLKYGVMEYGL